MRVAPLFLALALPGAASERTVQQGIAVELAVEPVAAGQPLQEETEVAVRFRLSDAATGSPLSGAYPAGWMDLLDEGKTAGQGCVEHIEEWLGGSLFARPEIDLNSYYVLALNHDPSITVVDPLFGFGGTKLLATVELASPGHDWVLSPDGRRLFVSLPDAGRVAAVDTASWKILANLDVGPRPERLAVQADGARLWVAVTDGAAAIDVASLQVVARLPTGNGPHDLALSHDGRFAFVSNREARTVSVIDAARLVKTADVALTSPPTALAWSTLASAAYVASAEDGSIAAVSPEGKVAARLAARPGLAGLSFAPGGRLGFVPNPKDGSVAVLDLAANRVVQTAGIDGGPDQVTFSGELAYVRRRESEVVLMIPLQGLGREGSPVPVVDFPGGRNPLGKVRRATPAASIVRAPGAAAMLVANPADKVIYYYKEGMAAPMGSFETYGREPRAVLVVDRSLKERASGTYQTVTRLRGAGRYRVGLFLDAPRLAHCFEVAVAPEPDLQAQRRREAPARVEPRLAGTRLAAGKTTRLSFRLTDPESGRPLDGLSDVNVLVTLASGTWHERQWAKGAGDGLYEVELVPPLPGAYTVAVECLSQRLAFHQSPQVMLQVSP